MGLWDRVAQFLSLEPMQPLQERTALPAAPDLATQLAAVRSAQQATRPWRLPSIIEALGVPAIARAVTLISNTTGSLAMQAFRDGSAMPDVPRVVSRPNPYQTPRQFYRDSAYNLATRGEYVWWIASRDGDGTPSALVVVPLAELSVEDNPRNRLFPRYRWGIVESTRYSGANPSGDFVHETYLQEPGALRGMGPLQLGMAAASVSVEAQEWAANFYADGGNGGTIIKSAVQISDDEAAELRNSWIAVPNNVPRVIDPRTDDVKQNPVDPQSAQMLQARDWQNGEAARMFGMPGALLEYSAPGSSLTYQNIADIWRQFQAGCLTPNYLEPIEQGMSDLLSRSTVGRFNLKGLLRADILTRYQVYQIAVTLGIMTPEMAAQEEGYQPGDVEFAPVPFAPPGAVPPSIPQFFSKAEPLEFRCTGMRTIRRSGITRLAECGKLLAHSATFEGQCPRCHKLYERQAETVEVTAVAPAATLPQVVQRPAAVQPAQARSEQAPGLATQLLDAMHDLQTRMDRPQPQPQLTIADGAIRVDVHSPVTVEPGQVTIADGAVRVDVRPPEVHVPVTVEPAQTTIAEGAVSVNVTTPDVNVAPPSVTFAERSMVVENRTEPTQVTIAEGAVKVEVAAPPPANVTVEPANVTVEPAQVTIEKGAIQVDAPVTVEAPQQLETRTTPTRKLIERDRNGRMIAITEEAV